MFATLELLAIKIFPNRRLAPATEKSYGEVGVLLATGYGGQKNVHELCRNYMAEGYGEKACHKKNQCQLSLSLSLLSLSFCLVFCFFFF
jgi:hypothetical protein